jgi:hypothetical protein
MSKALAGCRESYTRVYPGDNEPFLKPIVEADNYDKQVAVLGSAEKATNFLIAHPEKITGMILIAVLSSTDDFSVGVGSTKAEVIRHMAIDRDALTKATRMKVAEEAMNDCQKSLFNAGGDFVELVMNFVGAEDDALVRAKAMNH